jgi:hypothetical protein
MRQYIDFDISLWYNRAMTNTGEMTMNSKTLKRWAVMRSKTGSIVRKFDNREAARQYRRDKLLLNSTRLMDLNTGIFTR